MYTSSHGFSVHVSTLRRDLGQNFRRKYRARKRIYLTDKHPGEVLTYSRVWLPQSKFLVEVWDISWYPLLVFLTPYLITKTGFLR